MGNFPETVSITFDISKEQVTEDLLGELAHLCNSQFIDLPDVMKIQSLLEHSYKIPYPDYAEKAKLFLLDDKILKGFNNLY